MKLLLTALAMAAGLSGSLRAGEYVVHSFKKIQLTSEFWAEGAHFGDLNKDGENDIVYGPFWWAGPDFQKRHEYAPATQTFKRKKEDGTEEQGKGFDPHGYSKNFFAFTHDLNNDQWPDILILGFPGEESAWYENPRGGTGHWNRHVALEVTDNESPTFADITGDGKPEIVCSSKGAYGYAAPDWANPTRLWSWHNITSNNNYHKFTHGMGLGDVNGDGRTDLLEKDGWWAQPASLAGDPIWTKHSYAFTKEHGGAQMYTYDVDADGDNDVVTALAAHGYGLAWFENVKENGQITFKQHLIMGKEAGENRYGIKFSQLHAVDLVDMDRDGVKDIVTGKRWWAHGPKGDAEPNAPAVSYWFKLNRTPAGIDFIPYQIDDDSGVGTQVVGGRINRDEWPDVVVGNKKGAFVLLHQAEKATQPQFEKAQPKPLAAN